MLHSAAFMEGNTLPPRYGRILNTAYLIMLVLAALVAIGHAIFGRG